MSTWMIEGTWTGYRSEQRRVVHREYTKDQKFVSAVRAIGGAIRYTDGTSLLLSITEIRRKEWAEIHSYDDLIRKCAAGGFKSVAELNGIKEGS